MNKASRPFFSLQTLPDLPANLTNTHEQAWLSTPLELDAVDDHEGKATAGGISA